MARNPAPRADAGSKNDVQIAAQANSVGLTMSIFYHLRVKPRKRLGALCHFREKHDQTTGVSELCDADVPR